MKVEGRQLRIIYDNAAQYLTADNCAVGVKSYGTGVVIKSTAKSGYAILNDTAKAVLFPNAVAKPVKADSRIACGASTNNKNNYCSLEINGTEVHKVLCSDEVGEQDGLTSAAITSATSAATIRYHLHINNLFVAGACSVGQLTLYFKRYSCSAIASGNGVMSASVSETEPWDGQNVNFSVNLVQGDTWVGWYSDAACTNLVSTDQNYSVSPTSDLTLYAKATHDAELFTCAAVAGANISSASVSDPTVPTNGNCTFSATVNTGYVFDGWYLDESCTNLVSAENPYTATITTNTTLYAKAHPSKLNISVGRAEHGTASVNASVITYGDNAIFTFTPESDDYKLYGWYADEGLTQLVSEDNPYTCTPTTDYKLYPKTGFIRYTIKFTKTQNIVLYTSFTLKAVSYFSDRISGKDLALLHAGKFDQVDSDSIFSTKSASGTVMGSELSISIQAPKNTKVILYVTSTNNGDGCECICSTGEYSENTRLTNCGYYDFQPTKDVEYYANIKKYRCVCTGIPKDGVDYTDVTSPVIQETNAIFLAGLKSGYIFKGWYSDSNCTKLVSSNNPASIATPKYIGDTGSATSLTLYALGEKAAFTHPMIYFKVNGSYKSAIRVYKKVSGTWVEQTDIVSLFADLSSGSSTNYVYGGSV